MATPGDPTGAGGALYAGVSISCPRNITAGEPFDIRVTSETSWGSATMEFRAGTVFVCSVLLDGIAAGETRILRNVVVPMSAIETNTSSRALTMDATFRTGARGIPYPNIATVSFPAEQLRPEFSLTEYDTIEVPDGWGAVRTISRIRAEFADLSLKYGATVSTYSLSFAGQSSSASSYTFNPITEAGLYTMTATVTDSRGLTATQTVDIDVADYSPPSISSCVVERCDADGDPDPEGVHALVEWEASYDTEMPDNELSCWVELRQVGSSDWTRVDVPSATTGSAVPDSEVAVDKTYEARFVVADLLRSASVTRSIDMAFYTMDFLAGGRGIAFGCPATEEGFTCAMDANFTGELTVHERTLINLIYPVGSYYWSSKPDNPETWLPGTSWTQITDSFVYAAGSKTASTDATTAVAGSETVKLTAAQSGVPQHSHGFNAGVHKHAIPHTHNMGAHTHTHASGSGFLYRNASVALSQSTLKVGGTGSSASTNYYVCKTAATKDQAIWNYADNTGAMNNASTTGGTNTADSNGATYTTNPSVSNNTAADASSAHDNMPPYIVAYCWRRES